MVWGVILVVEAGLPPECVPLGVFFGGLLGILVPGQMPRSWLALGFAAGAALGYFMPTASIFAMRHDRVTEVRDCLINTVSFGTLGMIVGAAVSCTPSERGVGPNDRLTILLRVGAAVVMCAPVFVFYLIRVLRPS